jgi:hypothetical protein
MDSGVQGTVLELLVPPALLPPALLPPTLPLPPSAAPDDLSEPQPATCNINAPAKQREARIVWLEKRMWLVMIGTQCSRNI